MSVSEVGPLHTTSGPGFLHKAVGTNEDPLSKLKDFERSLGELGGEVDVAMLKFCYVDFNASTNPDALFDSYEATMARLAQRYPKVSFVHVTAPLTVVQGGFKAWTKRRLGKPVWGEQENVKRNAFNEKLRAAHPGAVFDLAALESTRADGQRETYELGGATVPALRSDFTDDGGHLNSLGRRHVAAALLDYLAQVPLKKTTSPEQGVGSPSRE